MGAKADQIENTNVPWSYQFIQYSHDSTQCSISSLAMLTNMSAPALASEALAGYQSCVDLMGRSKTT